MSLNHRGLPRPHRLGSTAPRATRLGIMVLLGLVGFAALFLLRAPTLAQQGDFERIRVFDVAITIRADGVMEVTESITYDFARGERRGILREIPTRLRYDDEFDRLYPLTVVEVTSPTGAPDRLSVEDAGGGMTRIRIGDPDRTVSGEHRYVIRYEVEGALNGFATHDELYWNVTGDGWTVPIDKTVIEVAAPAAVREILCFAGPFGSTLQCDGAVQRARVASFTHSRLAPGEGVTVVVAFPTGVVPTPRPILDQRWSFERAFNTSAPVLAATGALALAVLLGAMRLLWVVGRDRRWRGSAVDARFGSGGGDVERVPLFEGSPFPVEYSPPGNLRPGLIGTLRDEVAHPLDVTATIIDLATRHYLRIEEVTTAGFLRDKTDWKLVRLPEPTHNGLLAYERQLLDALFEDGEEVELSALRQKFHARLAKVQQSLYAEMVQQGWYRRSPQKTRNRWMGIGIASLVASGATFGLAVAYTEWALVPLPLIAGSLVILAGHSATPARTATGSAVLGQIRGFERFMASAELYRARFAEQSRIFYDYLPYAVVFGLTDQWAKAFEGLSDLPEADWYVGRSLAIGALADNMTRFTRETSGAIASTPSSSGSSGFGGGDSSGGGGGGGGGGSW